MSLDRVRKILVALLLITGLVGDSLAVYHTTAEDVILEAIESGNPIPIYADARLLLGYPIETIQAAEKAAVEALFDPTTSDETRREIQPWHGVTLVFTDPWEQAPGGFDPVQMAGLRQVFSQGRYRVLRVEQE